MHVAGVERVPSDPARPVTTHSSPPPPIRPVADHRATGPAATDLRSRVPVLYPPCLPAASAAAVSPPVASGARLRFLQHADRPVLMIDLSGLRDASAVLAEIRTARDLAARQPPASLLVLTLVRGTAHSPVLLDALRELAGRNKPFVRAGAVVGMEGVYRMLYRTMVRFSGRNIEAFDEVGPALDWLITQDPASTE